MRFLANILPDITLNCILWVDTHSGALREGGVALHYTNSQVYFTLGLKVVSPIRVSSIDQVDLFKNYYLR